MRDHLLRRAVALALGVAMTLAAYDRICAYVVTGPRWPGSAVSYLVNPENADLSPAAALTAVQAAAAAWSLQTLADIQLQYAGPTAGTTVQLNGVNEVFFSPESSGTTIAVAYWWWNSAGELIDADIKFFDGGYRFETVETGCTGGWFVEDVGAHEFGHVLGLSHSETPGATMYRYVEPCGSSARLLHEDDIAGLEAIYPPGSGAPPAAPYDLAVAQSTTEPETSLVLTWVDASSTEAGYHIERSASASGFAELATVPADTTSYIDTGLTPGVTYFYRVHAFNLAGDSIYSTTVSARTLPLPPDPSTPSGPDPADDATGVRKPLLSWAAVPGATRYDVYFGTSESPPFLASTPRARVKVGKLAAGTLYHWRVVAYVNGAAFSSVTWSFRTRDARRTTSYERRTTSDERRATHDTLRTTRDALRKVDERLRRPVWDVGPSAGRPWSSADTRRLTPDRSCGDQRG